MRISEKPARDTRSPVAEAPGGGGALSGPASRKLPVPPRERRPALAALAVLLILGGALATTLLVLRSGDRVSAIRIVQQVGAGQAIPESAMEEVQIADTGIAFVHWSQRQRVTQAYARVTLLPGTLLTEQMTMEASDELGPGKARVGLALKAGQRPAVLNPGDRVQIIYVPGRGSAADGEVKVLAQSALVDSVGGQNRTGSSGSSSSSGLVTVIVDTAISPTVAAYAATGEIAVAELPGAR
ncbi:hypothetical protein HNP84_004439 [Thermocatellispora tengchongensis]|uniref:SAF domain-containing protein n=1 Tax=Thermocatellispora tengchongensis TaxID=1073253 RepID=A0A840PF91_9ACTN|nr:hypothetical protein [Thermocatellispora tengchongensis]MBB5134705.1 hypothetical protein [Thermocatellispora tengchongensis]